MTAYHVSRNGKTLGVYPEPDAREYYLQGRIGPGDLVWHDGMANWVAAAEVFGPLPHSAAPPLAPPPAATAAPSSVPVPTFETDRPPASAVPPPPRLHWALVLLFTVLTLGIFYIVWMFVQAVWVKKIDPRSNAITLLAVYVVLALAGQLIAEGAGKGSNGESAGGLLVLAGSVAAIVGFFSMRRSMLDYFNQVEPIGLRLSGVLTFLFSAFYLQHHMTRIARWKQTGELPPQ